MQQATFPLTIFMKDGKLKVVSTLSPELTFPLINRIIQELDVPIEDRYYVPEGEIEEDGTTNHFFKTVEKIDVDALCVLSDSGEFAFVLSPAYEIDETAKYQQLMREKLITLREGNHD